MAEGLDLCPSRNLKPGSSAPKHQTGPSHWELTLTRGKSLERDLWVPDPDPPKRRKVGGAVRLRLSQTAVLTGTGFLLSSQPRLSGEGQPGQGAWSWRASVVVFVQEACAFSIAGNLAPVPLSPAPQRCLLSSQTASTTQPKSSRAPWTACPRP